MEIMYSINHDDHIPMTIRLNHKNLPRLTENKDAKINCSIINWKNCLTRY